MNSEFNNQLEGEIDRCLKDLPELTVPADLLPRTMNAIAKPEPRWHVRPWYAWPANARVAFFVLTAGILAGLIPGWQAIGPRLAGPITAQFTNWLANVNWVWNALAALGGTIVPVLNHFGKGIVLPCVLLVVLGYAACVGFGTVFVRLAFSGWSKKSL